MSRTYKDRKDIRLSHPKGFQPSKLNTTDRIKAFGYDYFTRVDVPLSSLTLPIWMMDARDALESAEVES